MYFLPFLGHVWHRACVPILQAHLSRFPLIQPFSDPEWLLWTLPRFPEEIRSPPPFNFFYQARPEDRYRYCGLHIY